MSDAIWVAIITGLFTVVTLFVGWALNRNSNRRSNEVRKALNVEATKVRGRLDETEANNTEQHANVATTVQPLIQELRDFRQEFRTWREEHNREHALLEDAIRYRK